MKTIFAAWMIVLFMAIGCAAEPKIITGTVVDAETGKPIEGAVVLVEWTKAEGVPGLASTKSYKVVETISDKDGKFAIEDVKKILIDPPDVTVYKKGYVAWSSWLIFPSHKRKSDFKWKDGHIYKMEKFDEGKATYENHIYFIHIATHSSLGNKKLISDAYRWEELRASHELDEKWRKQKEHSQK